jgi:hypothetical protein
MTSTYGQGTSVVVSFPNLSLKTEVNRDILAHNLSNTQQRS